MSARNQLNATHFGRIKDGRGRKVSALNPEVMYRPHAHGLVPPEALRRIVERLGVSTSTGSSGVWWVLSSFVVLFLAGMIVASLQPLLSGTRAGILTLCLTGPLFMVLVVLAVRMGGRLFTSEQTTRMMLKYYRCPHCGYDLRLLPVEPEDGVTICPECGCAWKLFYVYPAETPGEIDVSPPSFGRMSGAGTNHDR